MTDRSKGPPRRLHLLALLAAVGLFACGGGGGVTAGDGEKAPATTTIATPAVPGTAGAAPSTVAAATVPATAAPAPALDGAALLLGALDAIAGGYHFSTTVTVDGAAVVTAEGDHLIDGTRLTLVGPAGALAYVITPNGSWVQPDSGEWESLATAPTSADPLSALRSPASVTVVAADAASTTLSVTVPGVTLGIPGDPAAMAVVEATIVTAALSQVSYSTSVDGHPAEVSATIGPIVDPSPVVAPV